MFTNEELYYFRREVEPIIIDTYIENPSEEGIRQNHYFFQRGLWTNTDKFIYFYDRNKLDKHKDALLSICKRLQKFHQPCDQHAGTISSFDLMPSTEQIKTQPLEDTFNQMILSNHFANLVCGAGIATVAPVSNGRDSAFFIVLDKKYRSYLEG